MTRIRGTLLIMCETRARETQKQGEATRLSKCGLSASDKLSVLMDALRLSEVLKPTQDITSGEQQKIL